MSEKIEITVKVNGKEVPLSSISTETFEKIKTAEQDKSAPIASVCDFLDGRRRLLLKLPDTLIHKFDPIAKFVAISLEDGEVVCSSPVYDDYFNSQYVNRQVIK